MTNKEKMALIFAIYLAAFAVFCHALTGRYHWIPGQNEIHGKDYLPRVIDTWTGKYESVD